MNKSMLPCGMLADLFFIMKAKKIVCFLEKLKIAAGVFCLILAAVRIINHMKCC